MTDWYPLGEARVAHPRTPGLGGLLQLAADTDPLHPVVPGQQLTLALTLHPTGTPYRTYGYLMEEGLGPATVARVQGMAHMAEKARYAAYASGAEPRTVTCQLKIDAEAPEGAVVLPHFVLGLMANQGDKLVSSARLNDRGFRVRTGWLPGRGMTVRPGARITIPAGYSPEPGLRPTGATFARHGTVTCAPNGEVTYLADPVHRGYDRFALSYEAVGGHTVWSEITLYLGYLGEAPGALPETG
ncbi:hypothetical protein [Streptomyces sp. NPDC088785]|uniref:hypothetical protein n=1 Tax=Streptomyces sp. NPDC088785 TaxID=3365897 RepID=UPI0037FEC31F